MIKRSLLATIIALNVGSVFAQDFDFANDGRLTAPIYRYGDTAGNGQFWDAQEIGNNTLQFQYTGAGQAGTYIFGVDGTLTTPSLNVLNSSTFASIIFGDTGGNNQVWEAAELANQTLQVQYSGAGQAGTYNFGVDGTFTTPSLSVLNSPTFPSIIFGDTGGNNQVWEAEELVNQTLQVQYSGAGQAGTYNFGVDGTLTTPSLNVLNSSTFASIIFGDTGGNNQVWEAAELANQTLQVQYSGAGQAGTFNFGVDGRFTAPIFRFGDTVGNDQFWDAQEIAGNILRFQYTGAGQAGTYDFGIDGRLTAPIVRFGDTVGNGQFWDAQEIAGNILRFQYTGAGQAGTYDFGIDGVLTAPVFSPADTGGNGQIWSIEELANQTMQVQYSGAAQAGTYNFGVDGAFETPVLRLADTGANNQFWDVEELANQTLQVQYSGAAQAGTYNFGVNGVFETPVLQLGDTGGNNQFWNVEELANQTLQVQYSGAAQAGTYNFGVNGILEAPTFQTADTGGNGQVWTIEELADNNLQIFYTGNPGPEVPTYVFGANGTLTVPTLVQTSDAKFKENVAPLGDSLEIIQALQGVSFNWKDSGRESLGFVAQDIEEVLPQLVHTDSDGNKAVEYSKVVAVLVEALKQQQDLIENQAVELNTMRDDISEVRELSARLELLEEYLTPNTGIQTVQVNR